MKLRCVIAGVACAPTVALAQGVEDPMSYQVLLRMSGGLLLVVALVFVAAWGLRRFGRLPTAGSSTLQLLGGIAVGQRERVVLIRAGNERLLLGVAPGRVQMLHALQNDSPDVADVEPIVEQIEAPSVTATPDSFQQKLRGLLKRSAMR